VFKAKIVANNLQLKCMKNWGGNRVPVLTCVF